MRGSLYSGASASGLLPAALSEFDSVSAKSVASRGRNLNCGPAVELASTIATLDNSHPESPFAPPHSTAISVYSALAFHLQMRDVGRDLLMRFGEPDRTKLQSRWQGEKAHARAVLWPAPRSEHS